MSLLCYNKGCGQKFDANKNNDDSCVFHPGVPIFHDALKGWSCCKKRTTDFSEFLSIRGCTRGRHSEVKPEEPLRAEVSSDKSVAKSNNNNGQEVIYKGPPKSAETLQRERPSKDEPLTTLPHKVSPSLMQQLEKMDISKKEETEKQESRTVILGTRCKNSGCKTVYEGPETDGEVCLHHPGAPVFHEGYKYWSCCCIRTTDFNAFLEQKGCSSDKHRWVPKQDKKKVACRHDWHQTGNNVVVTIYAKNTNPELSTIKANQTVLSCLIHFENNKMFRRDFHLWGVVSVKQSSVNMLPSKVEVTLRKADPVSWAKLEDPHHRAAAEPAEASLPEPGWDIEDDDISDSDEEWAYDTPENRAMEEQRKERQRKEEEQMKVKREEVEEEMKRAMEARRRKEEQLRKQQEEEEEEEEGYEDMPQLEDDDAD